MILVRVQSEVLDRLLELNHKRHADDAAAGGGGKTSKPSRKVKASKTTGPSLFGENEPDERD